ncbi:hypothetical protein [Legionella maioricensis]|uniref:Uncharacterized protein n=1 Tax=Legionella maioricensis TaxID=2896528 RepID=A0A9X2D4F1_9GAMM|nr:hypothetical protein [Legionella maioricensis]MCL9685860.1 hypothetical protein [Legionella maioricensis]MCL9688966.1 hypothetical protein [Legionella maioricensis]
MKKTPRQPDMEEWLLDSLHGVHDGEEDENEALKPEHFINPLTYDYVKHLQPKQRSWWVEHYFRKAMSQSIWPRILIARCRVLITHALPLLADGHWAMMEVILNALRTVMQYLGILLHGVRLLMNLASLVTPLCSESSLWDGVMHALSDSWFELFTDTHSLTTAFLPTSYLKTTCAFSVLELGASILKGWFELSKLGGFKQSFKDQLANNHLPQAHRFELTKAEAHATALYNHQSKKLILNVCILSLSITAFLLKSFVLPSLSLALVSNPVTPLIFAIVALSLSLANHYLGQYIDKEKPKIKTSQLSGRVSFFKENVPVLSREQHVIESPSQPLEVSFVRSSSILCLS